ncbi:MAG: TIGR01212 family radical SAM protein [Syntrophomonas sp.]
MPEKPRPQLWDGKRYHSLNHHLREIFGEKVVKISLDAGFTCPNRDGTLSTGGCSYCSLRGSGDFTGSKGLNLEQQFIQGRELIAAKWYGNKYIAYFQAFSNTYAPVDKLRNLYEWALEQPGVVGLAIATRPDCLPNEVLDLLEELNQRTYLWIELGLQTIHQRTSQLLNMQYDCHVFEKALTQLNQRNIETCAHIIMGLPGETQDEMKQTAEYVACQPIQGLKIHLLHLLRGTHLARYFNENPFPFLTKEEYVDLVVKTLEIIPPHMIIHRLTGDGPRKLLIGPEWSLKKHSVLNSIEACLKERNTWQGRLFPASEN